MADFEAVLSKKIREQSGLNVHADWTDADIIRLSSLLEASEGVSVDRNRLKAIFLRTEQIDWDQHEDLKPAIARLSGFDSWDALQIWVESEALTEIEDTHTRDPEVNSSDLLTKRNPQSWIYGLLMLLIMVLAFFYWNHQRKNTRSAANEQLSAPAQVQPK